VRDAWTVSPSNVVVAGTDVRDDVAMFGASYAPRPTIARDATTAWYAEDDIRAPASPLSLSLGLRREQPQGTAAVTVPSIGVDERLGDAGALRANYARSFRTPTLDERYFPNFGTPTLQPEYGATFDIGVTRAVGPGLASLTYFGTDTSNLIVDVTIDSFGDVAPENVARARVRGLDAFYRAPIGGRFAISASYTAYPVARDLTIGTRLLYRPTATGALRFERDAPSGAIGVDLRYVGRRFADENNTTLLPPFATVGAFARRSLGGGASLSLRADNLTGERVQESFGYPVMGPTLSLTLAQSWPH
jgi:vitamin B12 transporter